MLESQYYMTVANLRATHSGAVREALTRLVDQGVEGVIVIAPLVSVTEALAGLTGDLPWSLSKAPQTRGLTSLPSIREPAHCRRPDICSTKVTTTCGTLPDHLTGSSRHNERKDGSTPSPVQASRHRPLLRGDWSPQAGFEAGLVLARMPEVTAVFVANDSMAIVSFGPCTSVAARCLAT